MSEEQNKEVDPRLEENWKIMTILQIPWHHILEIPDEHRPFLVEKAKEVEGFLQQQQEQQQKMQEEQMELQRKMASPIVTPNDPMTLG